MKIEFLGAAREVTGSCTLLRVNGKNILVDFGMEQGADTYENTPLPIAPGEVDCVLLTHAHIDHSGKIPALVAGGFSGEIHCTHATHSLCSIMLLDSAHIQEQEAFWRNKRAKRAGKEEYVPLYTTADAVNSLKLFVGHYYQDEFELFSGVKVKFIDAGHLLGSASIEITYTENGQTKTILFSGDVGNVSRPLIKDPTLPEKADFVVIESTYGNRVHERREDYLPQLVRIIDQTLARGGNLVIPSFAIGRTQELLYLIHEIKKDGLCKDNSFPVFVDSPLCVQATQIYANEKELLPFYDEETLELIKQGINILSFPGLTFSQTSEESMAINSDKRPKVIISASGMCEAGRIRHHLKHNLWKSESTILFVGYQAVGTLGRLITDGAQSIKMFGETIAVNAHIEQLRGISGHADCNMLLNWLRAIKTPITTVFVNHGDEIAAEDFANTVMGEMGVQAVVPYNGAIYDLYTNECLARGNDVKIDKPKHKSKVSSAYERLLMAGRRLMSVIEKNKYGANKDVGKFADMINDLCNKWDR